MDPRWYETFFQGVVVDLWNAANSAEQTAAEVEMLADELGLHAGTRVLDVPCGGGRHAVPLARRGCRVTGVDASPAFLQHARRAADDAGVEIDWIRSDMRTLRGDATFDAALCLGNSLGYFDHGGTATFLGAVARSLRPHGAFVIDTGILAESLLPNLELNTWFRVDDILFLIENTYRAADSRLDTTYTFVRRGTTETRQSAHHVFTAAELRRLLMDAGLETTAMYGSFDRDPFEPGSPRAVLVARKSR